MKRIFLLTSSMFASLIFAFAAPVFTLSLPIVEVVAIQCRTGFPTVDLDGVRVAVFSVAANDTVYVGFTGSNGSLTVNNLPLGDYAFHSSKPGFESSVDSLKVDDENGYYIRVVCLDSSGLGL